jgi:hypothetical protein
MTANKTHGILTTVRYLLTIFLRPFRHLFLATTVPAMTHAAPPDDSIDPADPVRLKLIAQIRVLCRVSPPLPAGSAIDSDDRSRVL